MGFLARISALLIVVWLTDHPALAFSPSLQARPRFASIQTTTTTRRHAFVNNKRVVNAASETSSSKTRKSSSNDFPFFKPFWDPHHNDMKLTDATTSTSASKGMMMMESFRRQGEEKGNLPMGNQGINNKKNSEIDTAQTLFLPVLALILAAGVGATVTRMGWTVTDVVAVVEHFVANPQAVLQGVIDAVEAMGPAGVVYFGIFYLLAEVLAVPATPLTLSAGYLFGLTQGVGVVLTAATIAASIAFFVGKTFLRSWVEGILEENPKFAKLDKAIGEQGFKLLILVRLSPIFPFALSNYVYGASSISFPAYFWGTLLGFTPGTIAYVYTGMVGKELMLGGDGSQPWYMYAAGFGVLLAFLKLVTDVASGIVEAIDDDTDVDQQPTAP